MDISLISLQQRCHEFYSSKVPLASLVILVNRDPKASRVSLADLEMMEKRETLDQLEILVLGEKLECKELLEKRLDKISYQNFQYFTSKIF